VISPNPAYVSELIEIVKTSPFPSHIRYAEARVFGQNDELLAHGTSTLMVLPGKSLAITAKKYL
jgi:hypothetical protein